MKTYKIIEIMGDFELLVNKEIQANNDEEAKKLIVKEIKDNMEKYLYPVVEVKDEI